MESNGSTAVVGAKFELHKANEQRVTLLHASLVVFSNDLAGWGDRVGLENSHMMVVRLKKMCNVDESYSKLFPDGVLGAQRPQQYPHVK